MTKPFIKIVSPDGYSFSDGPIMQQIKVASSGLKGEDFKSLIKRAGYAFADHIKKIELKPGDVPVHLFALGATEYYGPNRNGDGFKVAACRQYHDTFVKYARWYRNHENKNPEKSYGYVKLSAYNERMHRVELVVILNSTKEAADRNGGLIADVELEKLSSGKDIPVSMACKVPFDVCSGCGNKARNRQEYCLGIDEGGFCKDGGLKHRIATLTDNEDNPILHADNPNPKFFDISAVPRGADRIAFTTGVVKVAGTNLVVPRGGASLAEELGVTVPFHVDIEDKPESAIVELAKKMAHYESVLEKNGTDRVLLAFVDQPKSSWTKVSWSLSEILQALAQHKIAMPIEGFVELISDEPEKAASIALRVKPYLPGVYTRLVETGKLADLYEACPFVPQSKTASVTTRRWAASKVKDFSVAKDIAENRVIVNSVRFDCPRVKKAHTGLNFNSPESRIADYYAMYKLALADAIKDYDDNFDLTLKLLVAQNYV